MFTSGMLAQKCKAAVKELIAGLATQVNLKNIHLEVALACINECTREENTIDKEMAHFFGYVFNVGVLIAEGKITVKVMIPSDKV